MTLHIQNYELNQMVSALSDISNQNLSSAKVAYAVAKILRELNRHNEDLLEARERIFKKLPKEPSKEDTDNANKDIMEILNQPIEVSVSMGLNLEALENAGVSITPIKVLWLEPLFKDA